MAKARVQSTNGSYRFSNEFQRDVAFDADQIDAIVALLKDFRKNGMPADPRSTAEADPYLELKGIEMYGAARGQNANAWLKNTRTGQSMFLRNGHHAKGLVRELEPYASHEFDLPDPYAEENEVSA